MCIEISIVFEAKVIDQSAGIKMILLLCSNNHAIIDFSLRLRLMSQSSHVCSKCPLFEI